MKEMNPEVVRKELVETFDFILALDRKPEMLKKLPKTSVMLKKGRKRMLITTTRKPEIIML
jgi:protein-tyrosine-phosphatase